MLKAEISEQTYVVRRLDLFNSETGIRRVIKHIQYIAWPDHGAPTEVQSILTFRRAVRQCHDEAEGVMLVHCSAGVGRAGSFICLDMCIREWQIDGTLDIFDTVVKLRRCRPHLVRFRMNDQLEL